MVRAFDSDEVSRSGQPLRFTELVDCPTCATTIEGLFVDDSISVQDLVEAPIGRHHCPACGHEWISAMTGWLFFGEAG